jgi:hypothetical protein
MCYIQFIQEAFIGCMLDSETAHSFHSLINVDFTPVAGQKWSVLIAVLTLEVLLYGIKFGVWCGMSATGISLSL